MNEPLPPFWSIPAEELLNRLQTRSEGLNTNEARQRHAQYAAARLKPRQDIRPLYVLLAQFRSPIILILLFAATMSLFLADRTDALIILTIILVSAFLGFWQEHGAAKAVASLLALVHVTVTVLREGKTLDIPLDEVVPGDIITLSAGSSIPGDGLILESNDLFVDEATLTGETYPTEKSVSVVPATAPVTQRTNSLFMGTHVISGHATAVIVLVGRPTAWNSPSTQVISSADIAWTPRVVVTPSTAKRVPLMALPMAPGKTFSSAL